MKVFFSFFFFLLASTVYSQSRYAVVIDEVMADPSPQVALPNAEWVELKNTSAFPVNLQNWRIADASGQSGPMPNFILQPDSFVIVCTGSSLNALSAFGAAISVTSFPSMDNDGDLLYIKAPNGNAIHALEYHLSWYRNELKKNGGWTLEMIDPGNPCTGFNNWMASNSPTGGTPGKKNSVDAVNSDRTAPRLKHAYARDSITIVLVFDEPVDYSKGSDPGNYSIDGITINNATPLSPLFSQVELRLSPALTANTVYEVKAGNLIMDCSNNPIGVYNKVKIGLPSDPSPGEWIINEILFDPRPNAFDYVEFYNNSNKIFDASRLYIASRNSSGFISSVKALSDIPYYIFPGDHIVLTEEPDNLSLNYHVKNPGNVLTVAPLPAFPDDEGTVIGFNFQGIISDELKYYDDWHFKLLDDAEGVALERIDPSGLSTDKNNWHSAASTAGYGTPGYQNSQYKSEKGITAKLETDPKIFSPDNDGRDDFASIRYQMDEPGYMATVIIFDAAGRAVRHLVRNEMLGLNGYWNWDGLNDEGRKLKVGFYIILTEIFNLQGKKNRFKNTIVLARPLN